MVITQSAPLRLFAGGAPTGGNLALDSYTVVLTQRPTQNVIVTAAATPLNERLVRAGAKPLVLCATPPQGCQTGQEGGTTILFTPGNWFVPQTVTVKTQAGDPVSQGNHFVDILHTVQEAVGKVGVVLIVMLPKGSFSGEAAFHVNAQKLTYSLPYVDTHHFSGVRFSQAALRNVRLMRWSPISDGRLLKGDGLP